MSDIRVGIVGATGYTGIELVRLINNHPCAKLSYLTSESQHGLNLQDIYPHFETLESLKLEEYNATSAIQKCDVIFLARGNGWAMKHARELLGNGCRVIDLAADFRIINHDVWKVYYGVDHEATDLLDLAVYGLPEIHRDEISRAKLVANPGCYPTSAILGLAPAIAGKWIEDFDIVIASASGVSGAGRSKTEVPYLFTEVNENFRAYNVLRHRHTPEIEQELSGLSGDDVFVTFTPHLAPITRGIHTTIYSRLEPETDQSSITDAYNDFYSSCPFIKILPPAVLPEVKQVAGTNYCFICPVVSERTNRLIVLSVIDNLIKGASGQAVQNMNLMFGLDETLGLDFPAFYP